uniref:Dirigent protein n=1 Tax=Oryza nivara TaxID=4536 RepID=A0A0E0INK6_ORYNI
MRLLLVAAAALVAAGACVQANGGRRPPPPPAVELAASTIVLSPTTTTTTSGSGVNLQADAVVPETETKRAVRGVVVVGVAVDQETDYGSLTCVVIVPGFTSLLRTGHAANVEHLFARLHILGSDLIQV